MAQLLALAPLLARQQESHVGVPGGLAQAQTPEQRAAELRFPEKNRPKDLKVACTIAPDHRDAHDIMAVFIRRLMNRIIASKYYFREYEEQALDWLEDQFQERAAVQFRLVSTEAKRIATTTGIGQNSVLYRVLRDMLLAYPAHGVKAEIAVKKAELLVWSTGKTTAEIHSAWMQYYEAYDRAVALTHNNPDVTLIVPAQDWVTRFTEMQEIFPPWVNTMVANFPARFTSMTTTWTAINAEALRQAAGRKPSAAARMFQLAEPGEMRYVDDVLSFDEAGVCVLGKTGCWRCGDETHLRRDCPHPASSAEINNEPLNKWARYSRPERRMGGSSGELRFPEKNRPKEGSAWPTMPRGLGLPAASTTNGPSVAALTARMDRQDAMFEAVLEHLSAMSPQTSRAVEASQALGGGAVMDGVPAPVMQMAAQGPVPGAAPFIVTNEGVQPEGYIYIGANQGAAVWGRADAVAASMLDEHGESGNGADM